MGRIFEITSEEKEMLDAAFRRMEEEREQNGADVTGCSYTTLSDFYQPYDFHISFFYDSENDKLYERTVIYATGLKLYQEILNAEKLVNESEATKAIAWMLLRNGAFLGGED